MPKLCIKARRNGQTIQLVCHRYCPEKKRSRTVTLGSVPINSDPDDFVPDMKLHTDVSLNPDDLQTIAHWLRQYGDSVAANRRAQKHREIQNQILANLAEQKNEAATPCEPIAVAAQALQAAAQALPGLITAFGETSPEAIWAHFRPKHMAIKKAYDAWLHAAQAGGIAKTVKRGQKNDA